MEGSNPGTAVPSINELRNPVLICLQELGGSATNAELLQAVIERLKLPPEVTAVPHNDGPKREVDYRIGWAKTNLKKQGLINNSKVGVWSLTQKGNAFFKNALNMSSQEDEVDDDAWQEEVRKALVEMPPDAFERFCGRLLRESGFESVDVKGRPGDGGIDGQGVIRLAGGMIGFPVYFQCKRYSGSVGPGAVRDFRGAMQGRGDRGLIITTGSFTSDARREATRAGAPLQ